MKWMAHNLNFEFVWMVLKTGREESRLPSIWLELASNKYAEEHACGFF
ncbi:hypothetical protein OAF56_00245 [Pirellulaceae bacterium]|nr:hypothetical protein [Pirellulaceae bacterium]MDB4640037.1 hypothetical protein [Pirellulaceae bacterium]